VFGVFAILGYVGIALFCTTILTLLLLLITGAGVLRRAPRWAQREELHFLTPRAHDRWAGAGRKWPRHASKLLLRSSLPSIHAPKVGSAPSRVEGIHLTSQTSQQHHAGTLRCFPGRGLVRETWCE
jgi:hypothetical protein